MPTPSLHCRNARLSLDADSLPAANDPSCARNALLGATTVSLSARNAALSRRYDLLCGHTNPLSVRNRLLPADNKAFKPQIQMDGRRYEVQLKYGRHGLHRLSGMTTHPCQSVKSVSGLFTYPLIGARLWLKVGLCALCVSEADHFRWRLGDMISGENSWRQEK